MGGRWCHCFDILSWGEERTSGRETGKRARERETDRQTDRQTDDVKR